MGVNCIGYGDVMNYIKYIFFGLLFFLPLFCDANLYYEIKSTGYIFNYDQSLIISEIGLTINSTRLCRGSYPTCSSSIILNPNTTISTTAAFPAASDASLGFESVISPSTDEYFVERCNAINYGGTCVRFFGYYNGSSWQLSGLNDFVTRIISVQPIDNSLVATGTPITITSTVFISSNDYTADTIIRQRIKLINSPILGNIWGGTGDLVAQDTFDLVFSYDVNSAGSTTVSTTTVFTQIGERYLITEIIDPDIVPFINLFDNVITSSTTDFLVGTTTSGDAITQSINDSFLNLSGTASSTVDTLSVVCNPFSGNFDIVLCAYRMIVPDQQTATVLFQETYNMVFSRAPLGYFTDFISIMATSTIGTLTVIDATVPSGLIGTNSHITLDLTNVLDDILYSTTTTSFRSTGANSGDDFYTQTNYYWRIIVSILFALYLMRRVLGSHVIPHKHKFK